MTTATTEGALSPAFVSDFLDRYVAAWNSHDADAITPLLTDDVSWDDPALTETARGPEAVRQFLRDSWVTFPDLVFDPAEDPAWDGDLLMFTWRMRGTMTGPMDPPGFAATGKPLVVEGIDRMRIRDGRIAEYRAFWDLMDASRQLGMMPPTGSRQEKAMATLQRFGAKLKRS
jgi:steroid delta-isomerase-like uncharacterized protein